MTEEVDWEKRAYDVQTPLFKLEAMIAVIRNAADIFHGDHRLAVGSPSSRGDGTPFLMDLMEEQCKAIRSTLWPGDMAP